MRRRSLRGKEEGRKGGREDMKYVRPSLFAKLISPFLSPPPRATDGGAGAVALGGGERNGEINLAKRDGRTDVFHILPSSLPSFFLSSERAAPHRV